MDEIDTLKQRIAELEAQVAEAEHHCKQAQEAFQAVSHAQPLGPLIRYHTIENQQREIQRLQQQLATAQGIDARMVDALGKLLDTLHAEGSVASWWHQVGEVEAIYDAIKMAILSDKAQSS